MVAGLIVGWMRSLRGRVAILRICGGERWIVTYF